MTSRAGIKSHHISKKQFCYFFDKNLMEILGSKLKNLGESKAHYVNAAC